MKSFRFLLAAAAVAGALNALDVEARGANSGYWGRNGRRDRSSDSSSNRDGNRSSGNGLTRGTAAWFLAESAEHALRHHSAATTDFAADLNAFEVVLAAATTAELDLMRTAKPTLETQCWMVDETSRGGTLLKKDVRCAGVPDSSGRDRVDLPRGGRAWLLVEALEHSLRAEIAGDASFAQQVARVASRFAADGLMTVQIQLQNNLQLTYTCTPSDSVSCRK